MIYLKQLNQIFTAIKNYSSQNNAFIFTYNIKNTNKEFIIDRNYNKNHYTNINNINGKSLKSENINYIDYLSKRIYLESIQKFSLLIKRHLSNLLFWKVYRLAHLNTRKLLFKKLFSEVHSKIISHKANYFNYFLPKFIYKVSLEGINTKIGSLTRRIKRVYVKDSLNIMINLFKKQKVRL